MSVLAQPGLGSPPRFGAGAWRGLVTIALVAGVLALTRSDLASEEWRAMFGRADGRVHMDWLLAGLGTFFLFCSCFDVVPRIDLATLASGFVGGTIIEIWGTRTGLWHYYTWEKPPLWILPAWSMSALANERILRIVLAVLPERARERVITEELGTGAERAVYRCVTLLVLSALLVWSRPALSDPYTIVVAGFIIAAIGSSRFPLYAVSLLACGAFLGIFLEIWGTTRHCWNYYDGKTPSPVPIFGHGLAGLCFWRLKVATRKLF